MDKRMPSFLASKTDCKNFLSIIEKYITVFYGQFSERAPKQGGFLLDKDMPVILKNKKLQHQSFTQKNHLALTNWLKSSEGWELPGSPRVANPEGQDTQSSRQISQHGSKRILVSGSSA